MFSLNDKIALITGSSQGLGLAIARGLAQAGAQVVLNGRQEDKLARAVEELRAEGIAASGFPFDVAQGDQVRNAVEAITAQVGPIDILVNNAGIQRRDPLETYDEADWRAVLDVNLNGVFLVSQQVVQGMIARRAGKIINITSVISTVVRPTIAAYAASKGGLKMLTKSMATEWAPYNIQVNAIGPGYFVTEMNKPLIENEEFNNWVCGRVPAGRWGNPAELTGTAVFLASSASDYVNGQTIYVDGGMLARL